MLSRVAERTYWAGRYLERAENTARLVNTYGSLLLDLPAQAGVRWSQVLQIVAAEEAFAARYSGSAEKDVLEFLLADADNPGSIVSSLSSARENFRTSREVIPREGWERINELYLMGQRDLPRAVGQRRRFETLADCVSRCQQITGLLSGTMSHGDAYRFLRMGNYLERADMTSRVVDVAAATLARDDPTLARYENTLWMTVLRSLSAYQMYRQYVRRRIAADEVVGFLLADAQFPRSVAHALDALRRSVEAIARGEASLGVLDELQSQISIKRGSHMTGAELHNYIDQLQQGFGKVHTAISAEWFLRS
ncbi:MAG: alpha-E domain-containing protein [Myxococcales bacterium]|nr:alpha-E domain-containing protein [Myxococcales bacterium]MDH3482987.1 alpha-E domain-containing protein [Myxococcales bacterium]